MHLGADGTGVIRTEIWSDGGEMTINGRRYSTPAGGGQLSVDFNEDGQPVVLMDGEPLTAIGEGPAIGDPLDEAVVRGLMERANKLLRGLDTDQMRDLLDWVDEVRTDRALAELARLLEGRDAVDEKAAGKVRGLVAKVKHGVEQADLRRLKTLAGRLDEPDALAPLCGLVERMYRTLQEQKADELRTRAAELKKVLDRGRSKRRTGLEKGARKHATDLINRLLERNRVMREGDAGDAADRKEPPPAQSKEAF
jgi:hypothetical protein